MDDKTVRPSATRIRWAVKIPAYLWGMLAGEDKHKHQIVVKWLRERFILFTLPPEGPLRVFYFEHPAMAQELTDDFIRPYTQYGGDPEKITIPETGEKLDEYRRKRRNRVERRYRERIAERESGIRKSQSLKLDRPRDKRGRFKSRPKCRRAKPVTVTTKQPESE